MNISYLSFKGRKNYSYFFIFQKHLIKLSLKRPNTRSHIEGTQDDTAKSSLHTYHVL